MVENDVGWACSIEGERLEMRTKCDRKPEEGLVCGPEYRTNVSEQRVLFFHEDGDIRFQYVITSQKPVFVVTAAST
jgi:hypothetical protein